MRFELHTTLLLLLTGAALWRIRREYIKNRWRGERSPGIRYINTDEKVCALTFDDGPHPQVTSSILDTLKKHNIRATFFVVGKNVEKHPALMNRIRNEGHDVGNHTYSHARLSFCNKTAMFREIEKLETILHKTIGEGSVYLRPPHGRLMGEQKALLETRHPWKVIMWDICTYDWELSETEPILSNIKGNLKPGSIILLHDVHLNTATSLSAIIHLIESEGYRCLTISELLSHGTAATINR